ncbi:MAG: class I SAM-dependent methyltransferase [Oligoflexia bacterium]|nr:class I SAM-dependent methyltransferase [Oligoflexia bacterium]
MKPQEFWDSYYQKNTYLKGKDADAFLTQMLSRLKKGKVLDIGMGEGVNSVFLAKSGFHVKGFDASKVAIERAQSLAQQSGVELEVKQGDLDLYLFGLMEYDSIVMFYFKPSVTRYYSEIVRALKQGGTLLINSYTVDEMKEPLSPEDTRNYFYRSNEILHNLKGMRILYYNEGFVGGKHVVQCLAQKPLDKDAAKYNLFDMHTKDGGDKGKSTQQQLAEALFKKK